MSHDKTHVSWNKTVEASSRQETNKVIFDFLRLNFLIHLYIMIMKKTHFSCVSSSVRETVQQTKDHGLLLGHLAVWLSDHCEKLFR